ncbi:CsbD family protein [Anatilimnocola floriformis]|uniref:CsbD family protein n=1 Tax=Anatilimnocola floriformis TaxID=2948575 RepID=UPI0020C28A99|nr:CsbD family protein [Anatilimnocola floriformis]
MPNAQTLQGNWNEIKGKLRTKWGQLTNDDLGAFNGNVDQLVGMIQRKTGEARQAIEQFLDSFNKGGSSIAGQAAEYASQATNRIAEYAQGAGEYATDFASHAGERVQQGFQQGTEQANEMVRQGYKQATRVVRHNPAESVAVCFGAGVLVGLMFGMMLSNR